MWYLAKGVREVIGDRALTNKKRPYVLTGWMQQAVGQGRVIPVSDTVLTRERCHTDICTDTCLCYWTQWLDIVLIGETGRERERHRKRLC
jgi:hypothetical protein